MKEVFELKLGIKIYAAVLILISIVIQCIGVEIDPEVIGGIFGALTFLFLVPYFLGWLVWRFLGKRQAAGNAMFFVFLTFFFLANLGVQAARLAQ